MSRTSSKSAPFRKGSRVQWNWGAHKAQGEVVERFERRVQRTIEGERIVRNGSAAAPAYLIRQADGGQVLKSHTELKGE